MSKKPLIGVSLFVVVLLILGSLTNVVGYQMVQSLNQQIIHKEVNERELLFQTIMDISNNKEIQRIIFKSQMISGRFIGSGIKFPVIKTPILTKDQLRKMYIIGVIFLKNINKVKIGSIVQYFQLSNPKIPQEVSAVIEKDISLNGELAQLSNSGCYCENEINGQWSYPIRCMLLLPLMIVAMIFCTTGESLNALLLYSFGLFILVPVTIISEMFQCWWIWW